MVVRPEEFKVMQQIFTPDPHKGIINIGSDGENDIVIRDARVLPFHVTLMVHQKPYQVIPLDPQAGVTVRGVPVPAGTSAAVDSLDDVAFAGHSLMAQEHDGGIESIAVIETPAHAPAAPSSGSAARASDPSSAAAVPLYGMETPPSGAPDPGGAPPAGPSGDAGALSPPAAAQAIDDEIILVELVASQQAIAVEQTAEYHLKIINGGPIVATFAVEVAGVPEEWIEIQPQRVNLYEGGSADVRIAITPPRRPTSAAGNHPLQITVTSPNHPGRQSVQPANLEIEPYYEFAIGDLSPQRKTIPWRKRSGQVAMQIRNRGNSPSAFRLMAQDDSSECQFQFEAANGLKQITQVEYTVPAGETQQVPVHISPLKRSLVRLSPRQHPYRVSVTQQENEAMALFSVGTAISRPLIGILGILLAMLITAATVLYLFTPRIHSFQADSRLIGVGESTTLGWNTFFFTRDLAISGIDDPISGNRGEKEIFPAQTVNTYTLSATTWLWNLLGLSPKTQSFTVLAVPNEPQIDTFSLSDTDVILGDSVLLRWSVQNADSVLLTINGVGETFTDPKDFSGERTLLIEEDNLVSIEATNALGATVQSDYIFARPPSIVIEQFELDKASIYKGEQVTILWKIRGTGMADGGEVIIAPFETALPLEGELTFFPEESMEFVLTVRNRQTKEVRILPVGVLDPDAPPEPPTINFFTAAPEELTGPGEVELAWSISGPFDSITIKNGEEVIAEGLSAQGFRTITVSKSGTYVITSTFASESAGKELKITVNPALLKPVLAVTNVYPTTGLLIGDIITVSISCEAPSPDDPPPTGIVVVSDGTSSCTIALPDTFCNDFELITPGTKSITATYQGGPGYVQAKSEPYTPSFEVLGNDISLSATFDPPSGPYFFSQELAVRARVEGTNPTRIPNGTLRVRLMCDTSGGTSYHGGVCNSDTRVHELMPSDDGFYRFDGLLIRQMGGEYRLQVSFFDDDFYSETFKEIALTVSDSIKSPIEISASTTTSLPVTVGTSIPYKIVVTDVNDNALYNAPAGTVSVTAVHSDGVTTVPCSPSPATLSTQDSQSTYANCSITPSKEGVWTLNATYTADDQNIWHESEAQEGLSTATVNSETQIVLNSPPAELPYKGPSIVSVKVVDGGGQNVSTGSLACAFATPSDGTCNCSFDSGTVDYDCTLNPAVLGTKAVNFTYTAAGYLEDDTHQQQFQIVKASTVASIPSSEEPVGPYNTSQDLTLTVSAAHSIAGGTAPPSANNDVTIQLGVNTCDPATGMATPLISYNATSGSAKTIDLTNSHITGQNLRFCFYYEGSTNYNASPWVASDAFLVKATPTLTVNPTTVNIYASAGMDDFTEFTVTVSNGVNISASNVRVINTVDQSVICPAVTSSITCNQKSAVGNVITYEIAANTSLNLTAQATYTADASNFAATSSNFSIATVKATPTLAVAPASVSITASENKTVTTNFTVTLTGGVNTSVSNVRIINTADDSVICPATTTDITCTQGTPSGDEIPYTIAANTALSLTAKAEYTEDLSNNEATSSNFTITSAYQVSMGSVSVSQGTGDIGSTDPFVPPAADAYLWAYSSFEADAGDKMTTDVSGSFSFANFTGLANYNTYGLSASVVAIDSNGNTLAQAATSGTCTISAAGNISCLGVKVLHSTTKNFKLLLTPGTPSNFTGTLESTSATVHTIQNIIEDTVGETNKITLEDGGCSGTKQVFNVSGYAAGNGDPTQTLTPSDFILFLACEKDNDGNDDYDDTFMYSSANSAFSSDMGWDGSVPNAFSFQITPNSSYAGVSGCPYQVEKVKLTLTMGIFNSNGTPVNPPIYVVKDFEAFSFDTGDIINDDNNREDGIMFDDCGS